jgi:hypothetical protein
VLGRRAGGRGRQVVPLIPRRPPAQRRADHRFHPGYRVVDGRRVLGHRDHQRDRAVDGDVREPDPAYQAAAVHHARRRRRADTPTPSVGETTDLIGRFRSAGINHVLLHLDWQSPAQYVETIDRFAREVLGTLRRKHPRVLTTPGQKPHLTRGFTVGPVGIEPTTYRL